MIGALFGMIGKLLRQGAADPERAKALGDDLTEFRESLP